MFFGTLTSFDAQGWGVFLYQFLYDAVLRLAPLSTFNIFIDPLFAFNSGDYFFNGRVFNHEFTPMHTNFAVRYGCVVVTEA